MCYKVLGSPHLVYCISLYVQYAAWCDWLIDWQLTPQERNHMSRQCRTMPVWLICLVAVHTVHFFLNVSGYFSFSANVPHLDISLPVVCCRPVVLNWNGFGTIYCDPFLEHHCRSLGQIENDLLFGVFTCLLTWLVFKSIYSNIKNTV